MWCKNVDSTVQNLVPFTVLGCSAHILFFIRVPPLKSVKKSRHRPTSRLRSWTIYANQQTDTLLYSSFINTVQKKSDYLLASLCCTNMYQYSGCVMVYLLLVLLVIVVVPQMEAFCGGKFLSWSRLRRGWIGWHAWTKGGGRAWRQLMLPWTCFAVVSTRLAVDWMNRGWSKDRRQPI